MPAKKLAKPTKAQLDTLLGRGVETVIDQKRLRARLAAGEKLRVKFGIDPTGTRIHIGRAAAFWKLRQFQELGHQVVLIIGDFTAQIGDASDKLQKRPMLTREDIRRNLKNYLPQIGTVLDLKRTEVVYNSAWLNKLSFKKTVELAEIFTVQQMIERRNFKERLESHTEISLRELLYPIMQGYDSVMVESDLEVGGSDQLFNLMAGRKIQEYHGQPAQDIMTLQMLYGTDGRKMSTSWGNVINIIDPPEEQYGKVMAMRDAQIGNYLLLATGLPLKEVSKLEADLKKGVNPKLVKEKLAAALVTRYHGAAAAKKAAAEFTRVFANKEKPTAAKKLLVTQRMTVQQIVTLSQVTKSGAEAQRLIAQGAVQVDGVPYKDRFAVPKLKDGAILKIGKKNFFEVRLKK